MHKIMEITVNNKPITVPDYTSLSGALDIAGIDPDNTSTAVNGNVVDLVDRDATILNGWRSSAGNRAVFANIKIRNDTILYHTIRSL